MSNVLHIQFKWSLDSFEYLHGLVGGWVAGLVGGKLESNAKLNSKMRLKLKLKLEQEHNSTSYLLVQTKRN